MTVDEFWQKFLKDSNKRPDLKYNGEFQFGEETETICELTALVLAGKKQQSVLRCIHLALT